MGQLSEPQRIVPSVLVIAADPIIESLVGELVVFAGYRPVFDATAGAGGESLRRVRPEVALVDTSLAPAVVRACLGAAAEVGSRPVLMSSTASASELLEEARAEECLFFPLPGGPKPLERILDRAMSARQRPAVTAIPSPRDSRPPSGSVHPALCAAISSVGRARAVALHAEREREQNRELRNDLNATLAETRRSYVALRAAVTEYARQLRAANVTEDAALAILHDAICDCATVVGAESSTSQMLRESENWTRIAYHAA